MATQNLVLDGHKLAWHGDRVKAWLRGEKIAPITIDCALTRACNYKCTYCYGQLQENERKSMTQEAIFHFLDDAAEIGVKAVSFVSDGESTCSPHLLTSILRGKQNGLDMALGTNGALLNQDMIEKTLGSMTYMRFNISAADKSRYCEIHGCKEKDYNKVMENIRTAVRVKKENNLETSLGLQMVLMPEFADQVLPLSKLGKDLGVDYLVIKHCSDDENSSLGVDYSKYQKMVDLLKEAEKESTEDYSVRAKWSKILSGGKREYSQCYGPAFIMQFSGSGLVAPCGMLFNDKYSKYHIGNITQSSFKDVWKSERYDEVLKLIASSKFDAKTMCGTLCLQHKVNEYLSGIKDYGKQLAEPEGEMPFGVNFI